MRYIIGLTKAGALLIFLVAIFEQPSYAQTAQKLKDGNVTVRLCPGDCRAVNGHGLKPNGNVTVFERRAGWARVSQYLNRKTLVPSFGDKITQKPALWIPQSALAGNNPPKEKKATEQTKSVAKKPVAKRVSVVDRIARLRNIPRPVSRPSAQQVEAGATTEVEAAKPQTETTMVATEAAKPVEEPVKEQMVKKEPKPEVMEEPKPELKDTTPLETVAVGTESKASLTWEQVQAKIAAQGGGQTPTRTVVNEDTSSASKEAKAAAAAAEKDAAAARAKAAANKAEAEKLEREKQEKMKKAEEAAAEKAAADKVVAEKAEAKEKQEVAVVLPEKKVETETLTFKSANADPISFGARPKKLTKELQDKRLKKLPGRKSKVKKEIVIALRHYALGLLNSGECKGIAKGGASAAPGMLYVACTDDPNYLRQFPLVEESW